MADIDRIVYSINVADLQQVAEEELGRSLRPKELKAVEERLGDYLDWYGAIEAAIRNTLRRSTARNKRIED